MDENLVEVFELRHAALARFRRALRRQDQIALDELFQGARSHLVLARLLDHLGPIEALLLVMLIEEHKEITKLRSQLADLQQSQAGGGGEE